MTAFEEYEEGTRKIHRLFKEGKADTPEHEAVCDALDGVWDRLTEDEKLRMRELSAKLYEEANYDSIRSIGSIDE